MMSTVGSQPMKAKQKALKEKKGQKRMKGSVSAGHLWVVVDFLPPCGIEIFYDEHTSSTLKIQYTFIFLET